MNLGQLKHIEILVNYQTKFRLNETNKIKDYFEF